MLKKTIQQLEKLEGRTLDDNVRLCGELEAQVSKRRLSQWTAWAVHLLLFTIALLLSAAFIWVEAQVENGQGSNLPSILQQMFAQGIAAKEMTSYFRTFLTLVGILLFLPLVTDVIFSVLGRKSPAEGMAPRAVNVLISSGVDKKLKYLEDGLVRSEGRLGFKLLTFDDTKAALLLHGLCIVCSLLILYICMAGEDGILSCIFAAVLWYFLCELAFLISTIPMVLLFSSEKDMRRIRDIKSKLPEYGAQVRLDAMTPMERRKYELDKLAEKREREERQRREEEKRREEEEDFKRWMASKRCVCRFYGSGATCSYYSTGSHLARCEYFSNPGQCSAALLENALMFVDK